MTNRTESHTDSATWHLDRARVNPLDQARTNPLHPAEHIAIAQVEALLAIAEALRAAPRTADAV
jgi:hypothetical protein